GSASCSPQSSGSGRATLAICGWSFAGRLRWCPCLRTSFASRSSAAGVTKASRLPRRVAHRVVVFGKWSRAMLQLSDQALAHLCIAATAIPAKKRDKFLRKIARTVDPPRHVRHYRAKRDGLVTISPRCDPTSMAEFLHECGVRVLYQDRATLSL